MIERLDWRSKDVKWTDLVEKMNELIDFVNKEFFSTPVSDSDGLPMAGGNGGEDAVPRPQDDASQEATANRGDYEGGRSDAQQPGD